MVALDPGRRARPGFDHVRIERALDQQAGLWAGLPGHLLEHPDEQLTDGPALLLRVDHPGQPFQEQIRAVHVDERDVEVVVERLDHLLRLSSPEEAGVHEHAREVLPDGLVHQQGGHSRVHASGQRAQGLGLADLEPDPLHTPLDHVGWGPLRQQAAGLVQEALHHIEAPGGVGDLGVELDAEQAAAAILHGRHGAGGRVAGYREPPRRGRHRIGVAHPHGGFRGQVGQQQTGVPDRDRGPAVLAKPGSLDPSPEDPGHGLLPVADPQHRHAQVEHSPVDRGGPRLVYRSRPGRPAGLQLGHRDAERNDLGVDVALADPPGDELGVLGPEVEDEDRALVRHAPALSSPPPAAAVAGPSPRS